MRCPRRIESRRDLVCGANSVIVSSPGVWGMAHKRCAPCPQGSEVELFDVGGVEGERVTKQHGGVLADGELTELAGLELVTFLAGDHAGGQRATGVCGQVAQIRRVPQGESLASAVLDEGAHLVRRAQA